MANTTAGTERTVQRAHRTQITRTPTYNLVMCSCGWTAEARGSGSAEREVKAVQAIYAHVVGAAADASDATPDIPADADPAEVRTMAKRLSWEVGGLRAQLEEFENRPAAEPGAREAALLEALRWALRHIGPPPAAINPGVSESTLEAWRKAAALAVS